MNREWLKVAVCLASQAVAVLLCAVPAKAQTDDTSFQKRTYKNRSGGSMPYRLFVPPGYDANKTYPLVLWLHGAAGRGTDNALQISAGNALGTHLWAKPENQAKFPAFVLAPQCPPDQFWGRPRGNEAPPQLKLALEVLDAVRKEFRIDPDRIYVAGQSMGGEGTWAALRFAPGLFAAGIPLCGYPDLAEAGSVAHVPVWIFQGDADPLVSVSAARSFVEALRKADGRPRYTEYPGVGHQVWEKAFLEPGLVDWLAAQKRPKHIV